MSKKAEERKAKVKGTDRTVSVYKLKQGTPTPDHVWCNGVWEDQSKPFGSETWTADQLEFIN